MEVGEFTMKIRTRGKNAPKGQHLFNSFLRSLRGTHERKRKKRSELQGKEAKTSGTKGTASKMSDKSGRRSWLVRRNGCRNSPKEVS